MNQDSERYLISEWPGLPGNIGAVSTLRSGGVSRAPYDDGFGGGGFNLAMHVGDRPEDVARNRAMLCGAVRARPVWLSQVHEATVVDAAQATDNVAADASVTARPGIACTILTADCLPVLLCDRNGRAVGAAHAGWRGLASGVLENTVQSLRKQGAADLMAWLGPAIGPAQFEVGEEVRQAFYKKDPALVTAFQPGLPGKYFADIYRLARLILGQSGVDEVHGGGFCTVSAPVRFYSYRRDRTTGRMASLIWIKQE